jgi:5-(carboxyamino)imidazole ribonucleotide mutase
MKKETAMARLGSISSLLLHHATIKKLPRVGYTLTTKKPAAFACVLCPGSERVLQSWDKYTAMNNPDVAILVGSTSDMYVAEKAIEILEDAGVAYDLEVISAHREPTRLDEYLRKAHAKVYIAIAGLSAALPGIIASKTTAPVIGVPVSTKLSGLDALLSIVQMPAGVPVASVGIDGGKNAALFALRILQANSSAKE